MLCVYLYPNLGCGKEPAHQQCRRQETWVQSLSQEDPLEESMQPTQPTPVLLPGESHGQRSLVGYSPWGCEESDTADVTQHTEMIYVLSWFQVCRTVIQYLLCVLLYSFSGV